MKPCLYITTLFVISAVEAFSIAGTMKKRGANSAATNMPPLASDAGTNGGMFEDM